MKLQETLHSGRLYHAKKIAKLLRINRCVIARWCQHGVIKAKKDNKGYYRIKGIWLRQYLLQFNSNKDLKPNA